MVRVERTGYDNSVRRRLGAFFATCCGFREAVVTSAEVLCGARKKRSRLPGLSVPDHRDQLEYAEYLLDLCGAKRGNLVLLLEEQLSLVSGTGRDYDKTTLLKQRLQQLPESVEHHESYTAFFLLTEYIYHGLYGNRHHSDMGFFEGQVNQLSRDHPQSTSGLQQRYLKSQSLAEKVVASLFNQIGNSRLTIDVSRHRINTAFLEPVLNQTESLLLKDRCAEITCEDGFSCSVKMI